MAKLLDIDLWTANSFAVVIDSGKPAGFDCFRSKRTTPFVVVFTEACKGKVQMNQAKGLLDRIKIGAGIALLAALTGCVGYVGGGYGGAVVFPAPDLYFYGGGYEHGHEVHAYSHRGFESRAVAHPYRGGPGERR